MNSSAMDIAQRSSEQIANDLKEKILRGELPPKTRLKQKEIAVEYGVSLMPARDAIKILVDTGLAIRPTPKTFIVTPVSASDFIEIMELRLMLEPSALKRSAPRLTSDDIDSLKKILALQTPTSTAFDTAANHWKFHQVLYSRMGRPRTLEIIEKLNLQLVRYLLPIWAAVGVQSSWGQTHKDMLIQIEKGDHIDAVEELRNDIEQTMIRVVKDLSF